MHLSRENRIEEAEQTLEAALDAVPEDRDLRWAWAGVLERRGDLEGALQVFEELYAEDSSSPIVANNLASLLATLRDDAENMARASRIVRRLRSSTFAPFQDTFGWVAYRNGDYDTAVTYLQQAAAALSQDPAVQYHLAMAYLALERTEDAKAYFEKAVALGEVRDPRPQVAAAKVELDKLTQ